MSSAAVAGAPSGPELVARISRREAALGWLTNSAGAAIVLAATGVLIPVLVSPHDQGRLIGVDGPLTALALLLGGALISRHMRGHSSVALAWLVEDRPPSEREHRMTLTLALHYSKVAALAWAAGTVGFGILDGALEGPGFGLASAATIWLGGETTCALGYLTSEQLLRPAIAAALSHRPSGRRVAPGVRARLVMAWLLGTGSPLLGMIVLATAGASSSHIHTGYLASAMLFLALVATATGLLVTVLAAHAIADPLRAVRAGLERVEAGSLDAQVSVDDSSELGLLQAGFNRMAAGLAERERLRDLFGRQVGEEVARAALRQGTRLGGEERDVGVLFVDIVGSTSLAMAMPPTEVMRLLNRFFRVVVEVVEDAGALVNKFEGDAALCVFGAPMDSDDPAGQALGAARTLAERLQREVRELDFAIGVSAGVAVAGNVGAENRYEYTVIGDPVNEAARLCELAKGRPERVLASDAAVARAGAAEAGGWDVTESATLRGRELPTGLARPVATP